VSPYLQSTWSDRIQIIHFLFVPAVPDGPDMPGKCFSQRQADIAKTNDTDRFIEIFL